MMLEDKLEKITGKRINTYPPLHDFVKIVGIMYLHMSVKLFLLKGGNLIIYFYKTPSKQWEN